MLAFAASRCIEITCTNSWPVNALLQEVALCLINYG